MSVYMRVQANTAAGQGAAGKEELGTHSGSRVTVALCLNPIPTPQFGPTNALSVRLNSEMIAA